MIAYHQALLANELNLNKFIHLNVTSYEKVYFSVCFVIFLSFKISAQWNPQLQGGTGSFLSINFADYNSGFVTGSRFQFSRTTTGGNSWLSQNPNLGPEEVTSVFMTSPLDIYLAIKGVGTSNLDQLFISRDAGENFIFNRYGIFRTVYFYNSATGYCIGSGGTMIKTENAGQNWNQLNTGTTQRQPRSFRSRNGYFNRVRGVHNGQYR